MRYLEKRMTYGKVSAACDWCISQSMRLVFSVMKMTVQRNVLEMKEREHIEMKCQHLNE